MHTEPEAGLTQFNQFKRRLRPDDTRRLEFIQRPDERRTCIVGLHCPDASVPSTFAYYMLFLLGPDYLKPCSVGCVLLLHLQQHGLCISYHTIRVRHRYRGSRHILPVQRQWLGRSG